MNTNLKLSLIENAHDYFDEAIEKASQGEKRAWKYALINIHNALELLMKAVLYKEHWSLLFQDVNKASKTALTTGKFNSVDINTATTRLENIIGFKLSANERKSIKNITKTRNQAVHFEIDIDIERLKSIIAMGINLLLIFIEKAGGVNDIEEFRKDLNLKLVNYKEYVNDVLRKLKPELDKSERPCSEYSSCERCFQDTLIVEDVIIKCLFCGWEIDIEEFAEMYGEIVGDCKCGYNTIIRTYDREGVDSIGCVICGNNDVALCPTCDMAYEGDGIDRCDSCWEELMNDPKT
ncbi:hypothetical protein MCHI_004112 [Candidatus Magnetoovum chiemensis]|nr:hypothetical protein MCHI_004112 [Candidatus Magnetoovum chiemensis]